MPLQGGAPARVSDIRCHAARWSPDNRKIACAYRTAIIVMDADGSDLHTVGSFASPVEQMVWSPDGMRLRYVLLDAAPQTYSQWEMTFDGNGNAGPPERLDFGPNCCADWNWSADGKTFVMAEFGANGRSRLKIQNGPSSSTVELPVNIGRTWAIAPGKQDHTIYLVIGTSFRSELLKFTGGKGTLQNFRPGLSAEYLSYSRDGQWMSYTDPVSGPLWRSRADGSDPLQLMKPPMEAIVSAWSPDGQRIAFMGNEPGKPSRIYLIGRDGGEIEEASDGGDSQGGPSWSPDGREIVYGNVYCEQTQDCFVRRINLSTRKAEIISGSQGMVTARWSPDGKYIAALRFMTRELMFYDLHSKIWKVLADSIDGNNVNWSSDSRYIYVDSPRGRNPVVERVRVADGRRNTVLSLDFFKNVPGQLSPWVGLTPDNSPIVSHMLTASEVYKLKWSDH